MNCKKCGAEILEDAKFCHQCGEEIDDCCTQCGKKWVGGAAFCPFCGAKDRNKARLRTCHDYTYKGLRYYTYDRKLFCCDEDRNNEKFLANMVDGDDNTWVYVDDTGIYTYKRYIRTDKLGEKFEQVHKYDFNGNHVDQFDLSCTTSPREYDYNLVYVYVYDNTIFYEVKGYYFKDGHETQDSNMHTLHMDTKRLTNNLLGGHWKYPELYSS